MTILSICIPNYNRPEKLECLIKEVIYQIKVANLEKEVSICISDDCSIIDPSDIVFDYKYRNPDISINYRRNDKNEGMDKNFLHSVLMADSEYCWIIGNDDLPERDGVVRVWNLLKSNKRIDFIVTPFDTYSDSGKYRCSISPFYFDEDRMIDTSNVDELKSFLYSVKHNSGIFAFLSNVIFRRRIWEESYREFEDKLKSIFIQMYINISKLKEGSILYYHNNKIIRNGADDVVNFSPDRICKILLGLDDVVNFFFEDDERKYLKRVLVDSYISGLVWNIDEDTKFKHRIDKIISEKNELYKKYFVRRKEIKSSFEDKKIVIFGVGNYGREALSILEEEGVTVLAVCDSDKVKVGKNLGKHIIMHVDQAIKCYGHEGACFVIANHDHLVEMTDKIKRAGIDSIAIIT